MKVVGIDPSLNSLGLSYRSANHPMAYCVGSKTLKGMARVKYVRDAVATALDRYTPDIVALEGYALGFRGKSNIIFDLGELGGAIKLLILERGIDILLVPPTSLKLFATGKGNADKEHVSDAIASLLGVSFSTSDQYDAAGLLVMGEEYIKRQNRPRGRGKMLPHRERALASCAFLASF